MIAIIAAMDEELDALKKLMSDVREKDMDGFFVLEGKIEDNDVVLWKSGVGKTYAAISTTLIIKNYHPEYIINIGSAGSLRHDIRPGSVVIPVVCAYHDVEVPGWPKGFKDGRRTYYLDEKLINVSKKIANRNTYYGNLVSGDSFIYLKEQTDKILNEYPDAFCSEMEGTSIAQTADALKTPLIIIRSISDVTVEEGNEISFEEFLPVAAKNSAEFCKKFILEMNKYAKIKNQHKR